MLVESETGNELIDLRRQAHLWKALHGRAVAREAAWRERAETAERLVREEQARNEALTQEIKALKLRKAWLERQLFGRKSEQTGQRESQAEEDAAKADDSTGAPSAKPRRRGQQPGSRGHGRRRRASLPTEELRCELPAEEQRCAQCGQPFEPFPGTEDSEEIHWEQRVVRRVVRRARYRRTCRCRATPGIVTAPAPAKLIPKGLFSVGFWVWLILEKFLFQRPLHRVRQVLALQGLRVSQGTLTGGLARLSELVRPLYTGILERNRAGGHWHMDETRWLVFESVEGKTGYRWWLWVATTQDTCVYLLDPSRGARVPREHLGPDARGILNADRYSAYKALLGWVRIAYCWAHVRRDFMGVQGPHARGRAWARDWVERIDRLFDLNRIRLRVVLDPDVFAVRDRALRGALESMAGIRESELGNADLEPVQRKILKSLRNHWEGLTLFADHPEIPMDNNEAERHLRPPVVGRKNYYGSGSVWSGFLTAMLFTILQTALRNDLDPQKFLTGYLQACAGNGGQPPEDAQTFLPWNLSQERKRAWRSPNASED